MAFRKAKKIRPGNKLAVTTPLAEKLPRFFFAAAVRRYTIRNTGITAVVPVVHLDTHTHKYTCIK